VAEQVESMGASSSTRCDRTQEVSLDGYAKEMSPDYPRSGEDVRRAGADVDIVITTALIPGARHRG
jgi:NAD(P) transhydrogenase subunit alpha